MDNVSRPLIALLVGTVAFLGVWLVAFRPGSSTSGGGSASSYQSAVAKARAAVGSANAASVAHGGSVASIAHPASTTAAARAAVASRPVPAATPAHLKPTATTRQNTVNQALARHKVLALLFYNPAASDDRAVKHELAAVPTGGGNVVKLAVPISELARYAVISNQVAVQVSPTLVIVNRSQLATTIVGFTDSFEISQRIADALATR